MRSELRSSIEEHQTAFGVKLESDHLDQLDAFFESIQEHNPLLHLVAPCSAKEFAIRHILESLMLLKHLPPGARFVDVGAGAGLPSVPCLVARDDLAATLIESKEKKARFLSDAIAQLGLADRAEVVNKQFQEADPGDAGFVTCRALDRFQDRLSKLMKWGRGRTFLLFGGPTFETKLADLKLTYESRLMPMSEQRFLFIIG